MGGYRTITELPQTEFKKEMIDNCFFVQDLNKPEMAVIPLAKVFEWIKSKAIEAGLKVELTEDKIMLLSK